MRDPICSERPDVAARARGPIRAVTAAALFDGHDASINIMRRLPAGRAPR
jgi:methylmalonyl-CoA mutase cobalamin-binding subunit